MRSRWKPGYEFATSWTGVDWVAVSRKAATDPTPGGKVAIDPYLVWAEATDYVDLGGRPETKQYTGPDGTLITPEPMWVPVIIELAKTHKEFVHLVKQKQEGWKRWMRVSPLYLDPAPNYLEETRYFTAMVTREFFTELHGQLADYIARFELGLPMKPLGDDARVQGAAPPGLNRSYACTDCDGPVIGIIDDGLAFAHQRFQRTDGTSRIDYFWNQGHFVPPASLMESRDRPGYGWEFTNADIDLHMSECRRRGLVDEDEVYRRAKYWEVARSWAHGTHVMDLACGMDSAEVDARSPRIIAVQIQPPSRTTRDRSSGWLAVQALDGLRYVLDRAEKLGRPAAPIVVNLSFGHIAGPHDGSSMLEAAIEELIDARRRANLPFDVVVAAGNSLQSRCHASVRLEAGKTEELTWRILPDDATPSFMEIWLASPDDDGMIDVEVETPGGEKSEFVGAGEVRTWQIPPERNGGRTAARPRPDVLAAVIRLNQSATGDPEKKKLILLAVAPTQRLDRKERVAPCGDWTVRLRNGGRRRVELEAYIERDETPYGFPRRGRQSRFEDPRYERFDRFGRVKQDDTSESHVKRAGTINSIATGHHTVVIAGYRASNRGTAKYSSSGPQISAAGVSEDSITCHGLLAAGSRSGSTIAMNGTSVAAPQLTRELAKRLAQRVAPPGVPPTPVTPGREIVEDFAASEEHAGGPPRTGTPRPQRPPPAERYGKGRADARSHRAAIQRRIGHPPDRPPEEPT